MVDFYPRCGLQIFIQGVVSKVWYPSHLVGYVNFGLGNGEHCLHLCFLPLQVISSLTASLRFDGALNVDITEFQAMLFSTRC